MPCILCVFASPVFRFATPNLYKPLQSIQEFKAKLLNNSEIEVFAYDNIADYIYQKNLEIFFLRGKLRENMQVEIIEIYDFKFLD